VEQKFSSIKPVPRQIKEYEDYKAHRESIKAEIGTIDKRLTEFVTTTPQPEVVKTTLDLRHFCQSRLESLKAPIVPGGFYLGSTMLLWPTSLTCLGWLAFVVPPFAKTRDRTGWRKRILWLTLWVVLLYRWPTWIRNFFSLNQDRVYWGVANVDVDFFGFWYQEILGILVSFLIATIWVQWLAFFYHRKRQVDEAPADAVTAALDPRRLEDLSTIFLHWQIASVILSLAFIWYTYFFWDAVFRVHDKRYVVHGIIVHGMWLLTWLILTLPLLSTLYSWQRTKAQAISAVGTLIRTGAEGTKDLLDAIRSFEPISPWNLAASTIALVFSFLAPLFHAILH